MSIIYIVDEFSTINVRGEFPTSKIAALRESIRKWKWLVKYLDKHPDEWPLRTGVSQCSLCEIFIEDDCVDCPVFQRTRRKYCACTPYSKYEKTTGQRDYIKACKYAKEEVEFLESLLPQKSSK